jgi:ATP-dependent DNA helicase Rep
MSHLKLNPQQQAAVNYIDGPLLVLAGAGSGKTRVITEKISYLVETCGIKASHVLAVTFTNKAAKEMKARVQQRLASKLARGLQVATFHNFGLNFLQHEQQLIGLKSGFTIFDEQDGQTLLQELMQKQQIDKSVVQRSQAAISRWKNALILPEQAIAMATTQEQQADAELYASYQRHLKAYNAVDFDDLILLPVMLLQKHPELKTKWQHKIHYLLVDEYQDTNTSQYQLIKLLTGDRARFTMVGDDDQSIYAWRGAQPENLALLQKDYPQLRVIKLEQNYRSTGCILKAANHLIRHNPHTVEKQLWSELGYGDPIRIIQTKNEEDETSRVISELITHQFKNRTSYGDYAILYRSNHQAMAFEKELRNQRIPYKISGGTSYFSRQEIKDVLAYLRLLTNPSDDSAFLRIVNVPRREIGPATLEKLGTYASTRQVSMLAACNELGLSEHLSERQVEKLRHFANWHEKWQRQLLTDSSYNNLMSLMAEIGYMQWLQELASQPSIAEKRWKLVEEFLNWVSNLQAKKQSENETADLGSIINTLLILDMIEQGDRENQLDQVNMLTLHAAKGLEFPYVFIIGMEESILPHRNSIDTDNIEEERRLAYVGITRAQRQLTITYAASRKRYGEWITTEPSRFLHELPTEDIRWENRHQPSETERKQTNSQRLEELRNLLKIAK